ncbi:MAG: glycosyltransferase [Actinobacteria bacterium]|uniref:Unannotated protein n=1 Tax=freshwater metagenome TaxID=449393 RepID=A0A6J7D2C3_9ZZZZ|nr:glycosyltransferase [Actinomycetota bacterium]
MKYHLQSMSLILSLTLGAELTFVVIEPNPCSPDDFLEIALLKNKYLRFRTLPATHKPQSQSKVSMLFVGVTKKFIRKISKSFKHGSSRREKARRIIELLPKAYRRLILSSLVPNETLREYQTIYSLDIGFGVPTTGTPLITIVIPVYNQWWVTYRCLRAIQRSTNVTPFEVIVVDDGSSDETSQALSNIRGIKVVRNLSNRGYLESTNLGASHAAQSSEFIALLNNDTEPVGNWLDELVSIFQKHNDVAIVGSTLFYPDGRLQESGSQIFKTGNGYNIGKGFWQRDGMFTSLREVDYCSAASILVGRAFWNKVGGFDERYKPAYYEDTDLAMSAWSIGMKVYISPKSWVIHHEGVSHGTSLTDGIKKHQVVNREKFVAKWSEALENHWDDSGYPRIEYSRNSKGIVVLCDRQLPHAGRDSGSQRTIRLAERLLAKGFHVVLTAVDTSTSQVQLEQLRDMGIEVQIDFKELLESLRLRQDRLCYFWMIREEIYDFYRDSFTQINRTARVVGDLLDLRFEDASRTNIAKRHLEISKVADVTVLVSPAEAAQLELVSQAKIHDLWYDFEVHKTDYAATQRSGILFVGGFRHIPNISGVYWFAKSVLPELKKLSFSEEINIIGGGLSPDQITELGKLGLNMLGFQPELSEHYDSAKVVIVPLIDGAGLKGKLAEALSYGVPTVTTSIGAEGFKPTNNGQFPFVVSDDPLEFAQNVVRICAELEVGKAISANSQEYVKSHLSEDAFDKKMMEILSQSSLNKLLGA